MAKKKIYKIVEEKIELSEDEAKVVEDMRVRVSEAKERFHKAYLVFSSIMPEITASADLFTSLYDEFEIRANEYGDSGNATMKRAISEQILIDLANNYDSLVALVESLLEDTTARPAQAEE